MSAIDTPAGRKAGRVARLPRWLKGLLGLLAILGPGLISANAGNDAGGILTYASAGSQFGYRTLFLLVLITVALVVVQEMCSRLGAYTGEGLGALIREQFPLRSGAAAMVLLFVANAGLTVSEFAGVGASMELFGVSRYIAVPIALVGIWAVTVLGNYSRAERVFLVMGLVFISYPIAAVLAHPHWGTVVNNLVWPHFLHTNAFLLLAVALIGTTITPYMQFYLTSAVVDKGVTPKTYKGERIDTVNGAILGDVVSIFIIIATAAAIGGSGPLNSVSRAEASGRRRGFAAVRLRPPRRVPAGRDRCPAVECLCDRRDGRRRALSGPEDPGGPTVLRPVHRPAGDRRGDRSAPREPGPARDQRPGPEWVHHPNPAHLHPDSRQPTVGARRRRQRAGVPRRGNCLRGRRRRPVRPRARADSRRMVWRLMTNRH